MAQVEKNVKMKLLCQNVDNVEMRLITNAFIFHRLCTTMHCQESSEGQVYNIYSKEKYQ